MSGGAGAAPPNEESIGLCSEAIAGKLSEGRSEGRLQLEQLRPGGAQLPDVWLYSDGRVSDAKDVTLRANLHYDKIGTDDAGNIAIVALSAKRNYERPTEVQVFARLANFGTEVVSADVQLSVDGQVRTIAGTTLAPERWTDAERDKAKPKDSVEFTIEMTTAGVVKVEQMHKENDALAAMVSDTADEVLELA